MAVINKKAAIELSLNFIVILVLSIIMFGFGIVFMTRLASQANDIKDISFAELDERVANLVCEGQDRVCIGEERKVVRRKDSAVFGIKIANVLAEDSDFEIKVTRPSPSGYKKDKTEIVNDNLAWTPEQRLVSLKKNEEVDIGIGVQVPSNAISATYIFNIDIKTGTGQVYSPTLKFYVVVT